VLFILYAIWAFVLLVLYFILSYINQPEIAFDDRTTFITERTGRTGSTRSRRSKGHGLGAIATAGAAGAGLAALRHRSRSRSHSRSRRDESRPTVLSSRHGSRDRHDSRSRVESRFTDSYLSDEKYAGKEKKSGGWKNRLLGAGAAAGGIFAVKSLFNRNSSKKHHAPTERPAATLATLAHLALQRSLKRISAASRKEEHQNRQPTNGMIGTA
jgi:hypothetical protein